MIYAVISSFLAKKPRRRGRDYANDNDVYIDYGEEFIEDNEKEDKAYKEYLEGNFEAESSFGENGGIVPLNKIKL